MNGRRTVFLLRKPGSDQILTFSFSTISTIESRLCHFSTSTQSRHLALFLMVAGRSQPKSPELRLILQGDDIFLSHLGRRDSRLTMDGVEGPQFDSSGLASEWDAMEDLRVRLRAAGHLVVEGKPSKNGTIEECTRNSDALQPLLHRLFTAQLKLPEIAPLREEVEAFYLNNQRGVENDVIDEAAWELRKFLRFIKRKGSRDDPSLDSWFGWFGVGFAAVVQDRDFQDMVLILYPGLQARLVLRKLCLFRRRR